MRPIVYGSETLFRNDPFCFLHEADYVASGKTYNGSIFIVNNKAPTVNLEGSLLSGLGGEGHNSLN